MNTTKCKTLSELKTIVEQLKQEGKKIVFTNGCFDLLHIGHVEYLTQAKSYGDILIVGVNSDASIREIKGEKRPLIPQGDRVKILSAFSCIDYVILFDEPTPFKIVSELNPHVLVKGGDYKPEEIVGRDVMEKYGGEVVIVPEIKNRSSTKIIQEILRRYR